MKTILQMLAFIVIVSTACAQGTISISSPADSVRYVSWVISTPMNVPANGGFVSVLWAPAGSPSIPRQPNENLTQWLARNPAWRLVTADTDMPFIVSITVSGRLSSTSMTVPTTGAVDLIVIGWTGIAASFDEAFVRSGAVEANVSTGFSEVIRGITPPSVVTLSSLILGPPVPEPATLALGGLGVAALLVSRRRK